jgi:hypothetical protein
MTTFNMSVIASFFDENTTIEKFTDQILDFLFLMLQTNLTNVRRYLEKESKKSVNNMLDDLQSSIESLSSSEEKTQLIDSINKARTDVQVAFDKVIEWFRLSRSSEDEPFSLNDLIDITLESLKASGHIINVDINIDNELNDFYIQSGLPSFVDILFITLENVSNHSSQKLLPEAVVKFWLKETTLYIRIENQIEDKSINEENHLKIEKIKQLLSDEQYSNYVPIEGGSGFYKIKKILVNDIAYKKYIDQNSLDFGYFDGNKFYVEIRIPFSAMIEIDEEKDESLIS